MRITRTLTTAIAIAALAAPAAQARPADPAQRDMHASVAVAAAQQHAKPRPLGHAGDADFGPQQPVADSKPVTNSPVVAADDGGTDWTIVVVLAAAAIATAGIRRVPRMRVNV